LALRELFPESEPPMVHIQFVPALRALEPKSLY